MTYKLPEPEFQLKWHSSPAAYRVSKPNIGDADVYTAEQMQAAYAAGLAARVPEGWKMVPIEMTPEMVTAVEKQWSVGSALDMARREYKASLAAAPEPTK